MSARVDSPALRELYYGQVTYVSHPGTNVVIFFEGKKKNAETVTAPASCTLKLCQHRALTASRHPIKKKRK